MVPVSRVVRGMAVVYGGGGMGHLSLFNSFTANATAPADSVSFMMCNYSGLVRLRSSLRRVRALEGVSVFSFSDVGGRCLLRSVGGCKGRVCWPLWRFLWGSLRSYGGRGDQPRSQFYSQEGYSRFRSCFQRLLRDCRECSSRGGKGS